jgi:hypothetical protein
MQDLTQYLHFTNKKQALAPLVAEGSQRPATQEECEQPLLAGGRKGSVVRRVGRPEQRTHSQFTAGWEERQETGTTKS